MSVYAAVMTGAGAGAIATIQVVGEEAEDTLRKVFRRPGDGPFNLPKGRVLVGHILDGDDQVDQVTLGCEDHQTFAVHCHGNPLIVQRVLGLLRRHGAAILPAEQMLVRLATRDADRSTIEAEVRLALTTVKTMAGAELIANQITAGLLQRVRHWQASLDPNSLPKIRAEAEQILADSEPARLIIEGCTIVLIGPPNTGKSTLLNALAGREKAIVTDVPGTTRDWVSTEIHIPPLAATVIDTAGLDAALAAQTGEVDTAAQQRSLEILDRADLVLLVLDLTRPACFIPPTLSNVLAGKRTLTVLNKADLVPAVATDSRPQAVATSAKTGAGIDNLTAPVHRTCAVADFPLHATSAFTDRQRGLLERLTTGTSRVDAGAALDDLLYGPLA